VRGIGVAVEHPARRARSNQPPLPRLREVARERRVVVYKEAPCCHTGSRSSCQVARWRLNGQRLYGVKTSSFRWFQATNRFCVKAEDELKRERVARPRP